MKKTSTILALILFSVVIAFAQRNTAPMKGIQVVYKPIPNSSQFRTEVKITLLETTGVSRIFVKMGSSRNATDLFSKAFTFDQSGTFEDGTSYTRTGNVITLVLGTFSKLDHFFGDVSIERSDESVSDPISFNR